MSKDNIVINPNSVASFSTSKNLINNNNNPSFAIPSTTLFSIVDSDNNNSDKKVVDFQQRLLAARLMYDKKKKSAAVSKDKTNDDNNNNNKGRITIPFLGKEVSAFSILQITIIGLSIFGKLPALNRFISFLIGRGLFFGGLITMVLAILDIKDPTTNTTKDGKSGLITTGLFSLVRHPFYAGNILALLGLAGMSVEPTTVPIRIFLTIIFYILVERKTQREEEELFQKYGSNYEIYKILVKGKFFPHKMTQKLLSVSSNKEKSLD